MTQQAPPLPAPLPNGDPAVVIVSQAVAKLMFLWRHLAHTVVGAIAAGLVSRYGLDLDPDLRNAAEAALFGLGVGAYGFAQHWLETRRGDGWAARLARGLARLLVLGAPAQPVYALKAQPNPYPNG